MAVYRVMRPPTRVEVADAALPVLVMAEKFAQLQRLNGHYVTDRKAEEGNRAIGEFRDMLLRLGSVLRDREERRP